ncbi:MAG: hypothetical protein HYV36_04625 [Lentisphaerae bacterium]|nr:hypothetical protein [Lentisphaerota bacterium]
MATGEKEESDSRATRDEYAPSPALPGGISGGISGEHDVSGVAKAEGASPGLSARTTDTISLKQFVMLRMADTSFIITRDALVGAGGRMNSPNFILEGSFAQGMAIGFSADNIFRMNAGFQQNEAEQLEFWNVSVLPAPFQGPLRRFNPSLGEIANFSYELSTEARSVTVRVLDQAGLTVRTLVAQQRQNRGLHTVAWNGTNAAGNLVPDNRKYTFALNATNNDGAVTSYVPVTVNEVRIEVVTNIPVIRSVADQPEPFVPADGLLTISYETTAPAGTVNLDMTVEIFADSLAGPRVWWRDFNNQAVGNNSVDWDGTDDSGQAVPDGLYVYSVRHRAAVQDRANPRSGAITLRRLNTQTSVSADGLLTLRYAGQTAITITPVSPGDVGAAMYAIRTAEPGQTLQSLIYRLAPAGTSFTPPALMAFEYPAAIVGDIGNKLQIRRFNNTSGVWEPVAVQIVDSANTQIVAEITTLSLYALFAVEQPPAPPVLEAIVRLEPEALNVNPGILTAFVSLPAGYPASGITSATCDGALYERMMLSTAGGSAYGGSDDGTEMIIKFRRRDIEAALAEIGETIDVYFVIEGAWQSETGISYSFEGADSIMKIIGGN